MNTAHNSNRDDSWLQREAAVFGRYLIDRDPPSHLVRRYVEACRVALPPTEDGDENVVRLAVLRPWLLPSLDAVTALVRPKSRLRQKLLLMASILEASPDFADLFLPERCSPVRLALRAAACGVTTVVKLVAGALALVALRGKT